MKEPSSSKSGADEAIRAVQDAVFLSKVKRARQRSAGEKLMDGPRLFDIACDRMRDGIRHQFPDYDDDQVEAELRRRLRVKRQIDERGFFTPAGIINEQ